MPDLTRDCSTCHDTGAGFAAKPQSKAATVKEKDFLHKTLVSLGMEMDEALLGDPAALCHPGVKRKDKKLSRPRPALLELSSPRTVEHFPPTAIPAHQSSPSQSASQRSQLRRIFDEQCDEQLRLLEQEVVQKEAEVDHLKAHVEEAEKQLLATKVATARRSLWLRHADNDKVGTQLTTQVAGLMRARHDMKNLVEDLPGTPSEEDLEEDLDGCKIRNGLLKAVERHKSEFDRMAASIDARSMELEHLELHRQAKEAALFALNLDVMRMSTLAKQAETRVSVLAREVHRFRKEFELVVARHLEAASSDGRPIRANEETQVLLREHHQELFKYDSASGLQTKSACYDQYLLEVGQRVSNAHRRAFEAKQTLEAGKKWVGRLDRLLRLLQGAVSQETNSARREGSHKIDSVERAQKIMHSRKRLQAGLEEVRVVHQRLCTGVETIKELLSLTLCPEPMLDDTLTESSDPHFHKVALSEAPGRLGS